MTDPRYEVLIRSPNGSLGRLVTTWRSLDIYLRFNAVGSVAVTMSPDDPAVAALNPGAGIVVRRNGVPLISGPVEHQAADMDASNPPPGTVVITASDDLVYLDREVVAVTPAFDLDAQSTTVLADSRTGPAETLIYGYVGDNIGPTAITARRSMLTLAANQARGGTQTKAGSFDNLLAFVAGIALTAGLGIRALQGPTGPVFSVYAPVDRTGTVTFSPDRYNVASYHAETALGSANYVVVVGTPSGAVTPRTYHIAANNASIATWGGRRVQAIVSSGTTDSATLVTTTLQAMAAGVDLSLFTFVPLTTAATTFGTSYNLGDTVAARLGGLNLTGTVALVHITVDVNGEVVTPTVSAGDPANTGASMRLLPAPKGTALYATVRAILTRLQGRL